MVFESGITPLEDESIRPTMRVCRCAVNQQCAISVRDRETFPLKGRRCHRSGIVNYIARPETSRVHAVWAIFARLVITEVAEKVRSQGTPGSVDSEEFEWPLLRGNLDFRPSNPPKSHADQGWEYPYVASASRYAYALSRLEHSIFLGFESGKKARRSFCRILPGFRTVSVQKTCCSD
jgi:hypothetical protein